MLVNYGENLATVKCGICGKETNHDLSNHNSQYLPEFQEFENLMLACPECESVEGFSMNIDLIENLSHYPEQEQIQRTHLREIIKTIREDFVNV
jgi:hypothetical protein